MDKQNTSCQLYFSADIWFLDGFSPAKNPDIWSDKIIKQIARLSALNSRLATFTVAASVRSSLADAGFACTKAAGFGRKRDMLTASYERGFRHGKITAAHSFGLVVE